MSDKGAQRADLLRSRLRERHPAEVKRSYVTSLLVLALGACGEEGPSAPAPSPQDTHVEGDLEEAVDSDDSDADVAPTRADSTPEALDVEPRDSEGPALDPDTTVVEEILDTSELPEVEEEDAVDDVGDFVCTDDASCEGQIETKLCERARCVAGHCAALPDESLDGSPCDDGNPCTTQNLCQAGLCSEGVPVDCSMLSQPPCTLGVCDPGAGGCVALATDEGLGCDDGSPCTEGDLCVQGACVGTPFCDDGDLCNGVEQCDETGACIQGVPLVCDGTDPCLGVTGCDPTYGCVVGAPPDCGNFICAESGCPTSCEDHSQCVTQTYCLEGQCVPTVEDGQPCTEAAMCTSGYCEGDLCCQGGLCCSEDAECPLTDVAPIVAQESYDPASGFARVVVTPGTGGVQTFVPSATGVLERIDFTLQTNADEGYLVKTSVWSGTPGSGGAIIGETNLLVLATSAEPTVWTAVLTSPLTISAGETYSVGLSWLNGDSDCETNCAVIWLGTEGDPYPQGGVLRTYDDGQSWQASAYNDDLWFRIWAGQHSCEAFSCVESFDAP